MINTVRVGDHLIGDGHPVFVIGEIGINHNGDPANAEKLIDVAAMAGAQAVKFQKRTVDVVYSADELARPRDNPFGSTNGDLKRGLEFDEPALRSIDATAKSKQIMWFASCWDEQSVDFIERFDPPAYKIASASLTDDALLRHHRSTGRPVILSTGMSRLDQIDHAVEVLGTENLVVMHCTSTYPSQPKELNLRVIPKLRERYGVPIGYSGHELQLSTSVAAVALGACVVERHITLDRSLWGSDQGASLEPSEFSQLVSDIRDVESALGDGIKKVYESEIPIIEKLRRVGA